MHVRWILKRPFQLPRPPRTRRAKKKSAGAWPRVSPPGPRGRGRTRGRQEGSRRVKREAVAVGTGENGRVPRQPVHRVTTTRSAWGVVQTPRWQKRSDTVPILRDETTTRLQWHPRRARLASATRSLARRQSSSPSPHLTSPTPEPQPAPPRRQRQWTSPPDHSLSLKRSLRTRRAPALPGSGSPFLRHRQPRINICRERAMASPSAPPPLFIFYCSPRRRPRSLQSPPTYPPRRRSCRSANSARPSRLPPWRFIRPPKPTGSRSRRREACWIPSKEQLATTEGAAHEQRTRERGNKEVSPPPSPPCAPVPILGIAFLSLLCLFLGTAPYATSDYR